MANGWWLLVGVVALALGCGGRAAGWLPHGAAGATASGGGDGRGGTPSASGVAGGTRAGGSGDVEAEIDANLTPSGFARCGAIDLDRADDCEGIELITPLDPDASSSTDGSISVGESSSFHVWVKNGDDIDHDKACVGVIVDTPGITLTPGDGETNPSVLGQMYPGGVFIITPAFFAVRKVEPGTIARFTTWTTFEGTNCLGPIATVDVPVLGSPYQ